MGIRLYNTLSRSREEFQPSTPGRVSMYVCGLTVQGPAHLGHARSAVAFDAIRRYLEYSGYQTRLVYNFTDVDDKIIEKANAEGVPYQQVAQRNIDSYVRHLAALRVKPADVYPRATEHIQEMLQMIEELVNRGHAYEVDGDVYFSVPSYPEYGKLSSRPLEEMRPGERIELDERKRSPLDFTLWKAARPGEPSWPSPWGPGRPGWHIECSAMSLKYLGNGFDIHGGGEDLIFPHHENELAQSNCYTNSQVFARYWMHNAYVNLGSSKMSKSEGNVVNLEELLRQYDPAILRLYLLATHYRHPIMFKWEELDSQARAVERVRLAIRNVKRVLQANILLTEYNKEGISPGTVPGGLPAKEEEKAPGSAEINQGRNQADQGRNQADQGRNQADQGRNQADRGIEEARGVEFLVAQKDKSLAHFKEAMDDDFNTASALAAIHDLVAEMNRVINAPQFQLTVETRTVLEQALDAHTTMSGVLQVFPEEEAGTAEESLTPQLLDLLVSLRTEARQRRDFATGDRIRAALKEMGVILEDHREGTSWRLTGE